MLRPRLAIGLLLGLALLGLTASASGYKYKKPTGHDCGKVTLAGGFGGPAPSNVPKNAVPQLHTFVVRGKLPCATAKRVMASFEKSFNTPAGGSKGVSPSGWKCGFNKKLKGQSCVNAAHVTINNAIVYVIPKG